MKVEPASVVLLKTVDGTSIGLVKAPAHYDVKDSETGEYLEKKQPFTLVYVPGLGDAMAFPRNIIAVDPPCPKCGGTTWHWSTSDPLYPSEILCATCVPPVLTSREIRSAAEEIIELLINKDERFTCFKNVLDMWCEEEWPWVQKNCFGSGYFSYVIHESMRTYFSQAPHRHKENNVDRYLCEKIDGTERSR